MSRVRNWWIRLGKCLLGAVNEAQRVAVNSYSCFAVLPSFAGLTFLRDPSSAVRDPRAWIPFCLGVSARWWELRSVSGMTRPKTPSLRRCVPVVPIARPVIQTLLSASSSRRQADFGLLPECNGEDMSF